MTLIGALRQAGVSRKVHFQGESAREAVASGMTFEDCQFSDCDFGSAELADVSFLNCLFTSCSFQETRFQRCLFIDGVTQGGTVWKYCNLAEARFVGCNLGMNKLVNCDAYLLRLDDCAAAGIEVEAEVHRPISKQVLMGGMILTGCKMQYAVFKPGNYAESRFEACDLRDCTFAGSNLSKASFRESQLENIDFKGAILDGADVAGAAFELFDLSVLASYRGMTVSAGQHEAILDGLGLVTLSS